MAMRATMRFLAVSMAASLAAAIANPVAASYDQFIVHESVRGPQDALMASMAPSWEAHNFSVPIDHFHNESMYKPHSDESFPLRYWFDAAYYEEGGPVIVLGAGETSGEDRIPFLTHGIAHILAKATHGVAVVLEHRYYGTSFPVPDLSVENLRFLSTEQAMADTDYFARNIKFPGMEDKDLTAPETAWIIYGGSYAGAFAAFMRKIYPDTFWGGISASGVPEVIIDYWEYLEAARYYAPGECSPVTQKVTHIVDTALFSGDKAKSQQMKDLFTLGNLTDANFGDAISRGIQGLQSTMWDPELDYYGFGHYCAAITATVPLHASTQHLVPKVRKFVADAGYKDPKGELTTQMVNYIGYVRSYVRETMQTACKNKTQVECFTRKGQIDKIDLETASRDWTRAWHYQVCKQWGYFVTGSGVPEDKLPLISRAVTLEHAAQHCPDAFNITDMPDIDSINKMGGFNFSYPRLAFIDGAQDPWRAAGVHRMGLEPRESTVSEPFILVDWGVHHWEEYGEEEDPDAEEDPNYPPKQVVEVQKQEIAFVKAWMKEFHASKKSKQIIGEQDDEEVAFPGEL